MGDDNFTLISFSSTGSGVLQKPMNNEIIGIGIAQEGPVPENIPCTVCVRHGFISRCSEDLVVWSLEGLGSKDGKL